MLVLLVRLSLYLCLTVQKRLLFFLRKKNSVGEALLSKDGNSKAISDQSCQSFAQDFQRTSFFVASLISFWVAALFSAIEFELALLLLSFLGKQNPFSLSQTFLWLDLMNLGKWRMSTEKGSADCDLRAEGIINPLLAFVYSSSGSGLPAVFFWDQGRPTRK